MTDHDELVRERAYNLWEQAGRPNDRSFEFWFEAIRELEATAPTGMPSQHVVEQGVLDEEPEQLAFRSSAKPTAE
jgi:hypothetical protein